MFSNLTPNSPIEERIKELYNRNIEYSLRYLHQALQRQRYLQKHPTRIVVFKCMDGRVHFPVVTNSLLGIIKPFRRLGGKFNLGWPLLGRVFYDWVKDQRKLGYSCLAMVSYHFSKGNPKRGCAGFKYDTEAAKSHQHWFKEQINGVFSSEDNDVYPIVAGFETDNDTLIFHGESGEIIDLFEKTGWSEEQIFEEFVNVFPNMPQQMLLDLMPLVMGNLKHIEEVKGSERQIIEIEHNEWIIGLGSGFDWLHAPNTAIIIGPWHYNELDNEIRVALQIIQGNMNNKRIRDDGFVFLISSEWSKHPEDKVMAEKVKEFTKLVKTILEEPEFADIAPKARFITGLVSESKKFTPLEEIEGK